MSCLFNSLGRLLNTNPTTLRHNICDYIKQNPDKLWNGTSLKEWITYVAGDRFQNIDQYLSQMRNLNQWGGAPEIAVCCIMYNISVEVINLRDRKNNVFFSEEKKETPKPNPTPTLSIYNIEDHITLPEIPPIPSLPPQLIPKIGQIKNLPPQHPMRKHFDVVSKNIKYQNFRRNEIIKQRKILIDQAKAKANAKAKLNSESSNQHSTKIPILVISWTGGHYEPITIKNPRPI